jgi:hypothetical protein
VFNGDDALHIGNTRLPARGTLTFVQTENGRSNSGCYLDVAWVEGDYASDPGRRRFIFTLKNHLGVPPTKFAQKRNEKAVTLGAPWVLPSVTVKRT